MSRYVRIAPVALVALTILLVPSSSIAVQLERPGWQLSANTYPSNLVSGVNEVMRLTPEEGTVTLFYEEAETAPIDLEGTPAGERAEAIQSALEALPTVGAGNVVVADDPANPGDYTITFVGALGSTKTAELEASGGSVSVVTEGTSSGTIAVDVFNVGAGASNGTITITDVLPPGVKAKQAGELIRPSESGGPEGFGIDPLIVGGVWDCTGNGPGVSGGVPGATVITCTNDPERLAAFQGGGGTPTFLRSANNPQPALGISVEAVGSASGLTNKVSIAGGGAPTPASTENPVSMNVGPAAGGLTHADVWFSNADGTTDTQAGSHPYTATFLYDVATALNSRDEAILPGSEIRNLDTVVPPGLVGDLHKTPQCTRPQLLLAACPPASMVGLLKASAPTAVGSVNRIFNMVPPAGTPAELGFEYAGVPVYVKFSVRSGGDYSIVAHVNDIPQKEIYQAMLTLWGVPAERSHDRWRAKEGGCTQEEIERPELNQSGTFNYCAEQQARTITPFLTLPTACAAPQQFSFHQLSGWQELGAQSQIELVSHDASNKPVGFVGCAALAFEPAITTLPTTARTDTVTGLTAEVKPTLGGLEEPGGLSTAAIQDATVTLPEGLVINPGQAAGLAACGPTDAALTTVQEREHGEENDNASTCPKSSKVGTVTIKSPLIEADIDKQFEGNVYVLPSNPPEVKLLVAASADGVNVKLVGTVHLDEQTGRLTTTFEGTPQLPFSDFKLTFEDGAKAALATPTQCGTYQTGANFTPWSSPATSDHAAQASFGLTEGVGGGACPSGALPFAPSLSAGTTNTVAGGYTNFSTLVQRGDGQQRIQSFQFKSPTGLSAMTSSVPLCDEAAANAGTCPSTSHIGHAIVASGPGSNPLILPQPGQPELPIYLTGPYKGAPFGLSIVTPVKAGPFDLGTIVTRARIDVDPGTAQIIVTTDPLPQIVKGVPTDLRSIYAVIDRPNFFFNPTNCSAQEFQGAATSTGGASAGLSSQFSAGACQALKFKPQFSASTSAKTSKANGASLRVKIAYPAAGMQANIRRVDLTVPAILPTRLTTIQQACTGAKFNANPATCPVGSIIASATVHTPVLKSPLSGPVYFVSHGNAAFPDVEMVLQGEGVTLIVDGKTQITKGVTFSHFETVPDEPFSTFEFNAPAGPHSIFAANGNLCAQEVKLPTTLTAQNGAVLTQSTKVEVEGCSKGLTVTSRSLEKRALTLKIIVPGAGRLTASGAGVVKASKASKGRTTLTLVLKEKRGRSKVKTRVKLSFAPARGSKLSSTVSTRFKH